MPIKGFLSVYGMAYLVKSGLYFHDDLVKTIDNLQKAASLLRGPFLPEIYRSMGIAYATAGFKEKANYYIEEALKLDDDSAAYYSSLAVLEDSDGNYQKAIEFGEKSYANDSTNFWVNYQLGINHSYLGHNEEYLEYMKKYNQRTILHYYALIMIIVLGVCGLSVVSMNGRFWPSLCENAKAASCSPL